MNHPEAGAFGENHFWPPGTPHTNDVHNSMFRPRLPQHSTHDRLASLGVFDDSILNRVGEVADHYTALSYRDTMAALTKPVYYTPAGKRHGINVLDIVPKNGDYKNVVVLHPTMGASLNTDRCLRFAVLAATLPESRLITVSNPSELGLKDSKISLKNIGKVLLSGDLQPTIHTTMRYLEDNGVETSDQVGASFGADKAATSVKEAYRYEQSVDRLVAVDPASVIPRTVLQLAQAFQATETRLQGYITGSEWPTYIQARSNARGSQIWRYKLGLARASNLAISHALARGQFEDRQTAALEAHPELGACALWGKLSEMCLDARMQDISARAKNRFGNRFSGTALPGLYHAFTNDPYLQAAVIAQGLRNSSKS